MSDSPESKWRFHGVRVVKGSELDTHTPQTAGMNRAAAITHARTAAGKLWAGMVVIVEQPEEVHWMDNIHPDPVTSERSQR